MHLEIHLISMLYYTKELINNYWVAPHTTLPIPPTLSGVPNQASTW